MINYLKFKLLLVLILFSFNDIKSQSVFQTWPTIDIQGEVFDDFEIKLEYRNKYDNSSKESKQGRIDLGVAYKLKKIKIGIYYREIYDLKKDGRVSEIFTYEDHPKIINVLSNKG